jgi:hypothetical protein
VLAVVELVEHEVRPAAANAWAVRPASSIGIHALDRLQDTYIGNSLTSCGVSRCPGGPSSDPVSSATPASGRGRRATSSATRHAPCENPPSTIWRSSIPALIARATEDSIASNAQLSSGSLSSGLS